MSRRFSGKEPLGLGDPNEAIAGFISAILGLGIGIGFLFIIYKLVELVLTP